MNKPRFWMCMVDGRPDTITRHRSKKDANEEANRLAGLNHGKAVYVLEATHYAMVCLPQPTIFNTETHNEL